MVILTAATLAHLFLLLIPIARQQAGEPDRLPSLTVRLESRAVEETPAPPPEPMEPEPSPLLPVKPIELAELPAPAPEPVVTGKPETPRITAYRILDDLRRKQEKDPLASRQTADPAEGRDYFVRQQPVLEDVLNPPSLQLPFRDTRIYLVDSYDPGFMGGVQKFFDDVTVPFGFTTRNNTRVQCAWILVLAGCSWGDVSYYYAKDRARKRNPDSM